jgi:hypothetical protein
MFKGRVTAELRDMNSTALHVIEVEEDAEGLEELIIFIANIKDAVVILKNLRLETGLCLENKKDGSFENEFAWSIIFVGFSLIAVITVAGCSLIKRKFTGNRSLQTKKESRRFYVFAPILVI